MVLLPVKPPHFEHVASPSTLFWEYMHQVCTLTKQSLLGYSQVGGRRVPKHTMRKTLDKVFFSSLGESPPPPPAELLRMLSCMWSSHQNGSNRLGDRTHHIRRVLQRTSSMFFKVDGDEKLPSLSEISMQISGLINEGFIHWKPWFKFGEHSLFCFNTLKYKGVVSWSLDTMPSWTGYLLVFTISQTPSIYYCNWPSSTGSPEERSNTDLVWSINIIADDADGSHVCYLLFFFLWSVRC